MCDGFFDTGIIVAFIALAGTIITGILAFITFRKQATDLRRIEATKKDHSKELYIHQLYFESEFKIYNAIWNSIVDVRNAIRMLRPRVDLAYPLGKTQEEVTSERFDDAKTKGQIFIDLWDKNRPFYDETIFKQLDELRKLLIRELLDIKFAIPGQVDKDFWDKGEATVDEFNRLSENICIAI